MAERILKLLHFYKIIGMTIALHIGYDNFVDLLAGAHFIDNHFRTAPLNKNVSSHKPILQYLEYLWKNYSSEAKYP